MHGEGFGDYSIPTAELPTPQNLQEILVVIDAIKKDYFSRVNKLQIREFFINDECLADFAIVPTSKSPAISTPIFVNESTPKTKKKTNFRELVDQVNLYNGNKLKDELDPHVFSKLASLFNCIETIFSGIFQAGIGKHSCSESSTLVIGTLGIGKSTIIGYMQKAEIAYEKIVIRSEIGIKKYVAVYKSKVADTYPEIGHLDSRTKGAAVHGSYIDTAGIGHTEGPSTDLCNAEAIHMMVKAYSPKRLMVVIDSSIFESRDTAFFEMIDRLRRVIHNPTKKNVLSSVLFLVNDHLKHPQDKRTSKKKILGEINFAISSLEAERKALLPQPPPQGWMEYILGQPDIQEEMFAEIDPRLLEIEEKIKLLKKVLKLQNIIVADIFQEDTRKEIKKWEKKNSSNSLSFNMENFVVGGHQQFKAVLRELTSYFSSLYTQKTQLNQHLLELETDILECETQIKALTVNTQLIANKPRLNEKNKGLVGRNETLQAEIEHLKEKSKLKEISEQIIQKYTEQLANLKPSQTEVKKRLSKVTSTLETHKDYCQLIGRIIEGLNLTESENSSEQHIFNQFLSDIVSM